MKFQNPSIYRRFKSFLKFHRKVEKSIKISKLRIFVKICQKLITSSTPQLNNYTEYEGSSSNTSYKIFKFVFKGT